MSAMWRRMVVVERGRARSGSERQACGARYTAVVLILFSACGCATQTQDRKISVVVTADQNANPNREGRASPTVVQIFPLNDAGPFLDASLTELERVGGATLGGSLTGSTAEGQVLPADMLEVLIQPSMETPLLGVVAYLYDAQSSTRCLVALGKRVRAFNIQLSRSGLMLDTETDQQGPRCRIEAE